MDGATSIKYACATGRDAWNSSHFVSIEDSGDDVSDTGVKHDLDV